MAELLRRQEKAPLSKGAVRVSGLGDSDGPPGRMALPECGPGGMKPYGEL